ncbi:MAG: outer membrane protein assembly factor BamE [Nitrospirota bacterium]|nr:outer membrane protein assembly factor BamE [Nitrospirota bacterium]
MKKGFVNSLGRLAGGTAGAMLIVFSLLLVAFPGCTRQEGTAISNHDILSLKVGKTTEKEVLRMLGPPDEKTRLLGEDLWTYRHVVHRGIISSQTDIRVLRIRFDEKGILQNVEQNQRKYQRLF